MSSFVELHVHVFFYSFSVKYLAQLFVSAFLFLCGCGFVFFRFFGFLISVEPVFVDHHDRQVRVVSCSEI